MIAEQGQEIQKLNAHIARLAESDLVFVENKKLIEANRKLQTEYILFMNHDITKTFSRWFINHWENGCDTAEMIARLYQWCYAYDATIKLPKDISNANIPMKIEMIS